MVKLLTNRDVCRRVMQVDNALTAGEIDPREATAHSSLMGVASKAIGQEDMAARLEVVEARLNAMGAPEPAVFEAKRPKLAVVKREA